MLRALALTSVLLLPVVTRAGEPICVREVSYRLVGEDVPAPEKARMVEEQVLAGAERAGYEVLRGGCEGEGAPVLTVGVAESGALYDISIALADNPSRAEQFTGPFAGMLKHTRATVEQVLAERPAVAAEPEPEPPTGGEVEETVPPVGAADEPGAPEQTQGPEGERDDEPPPPAEPAAADGELNPLWASSLALTAVGGAALIAGVVLLLVDDPCIDEDAAHGCKERFDSSAAGIPLAGLGGIAGGVGIAGLVLLDRRRPATETEPGDAPPLETSAALAPVRGGAAAGVSIAF